MSNDQSGKRVNTTERAPDTFLKVLAGHRQWLSVKAVCERLNSAGFDAVLPGGCVRDALLGVQPKDFDIATSATPDDVEATFEKTISVGKTFGVIVVPLEGGESIEIATYRRDGDYQDGRRPSGVIFADRQEDARRRDFTVNALFYDPVQNVIIDYTNGREDIQKKVLRVVGDPGLRFKEDKLRLLRAVRFRGQLGFEIEKETETAIRDLAKELGVVSRERIRDEVDKILVSRFPDRSFEVMSRLRLAETVFADWASLVLPPADRVFLPSDLDTRRILLLWPALKQSAPERIQDRLQNWKYGRTLIELVLWTLANERALRPSSDDPVKAIRSRDDIIASFKTEQVPVPKSLNAIEWMTAIELWTNEKAPRAIQVLDILYGPHPARDVALKRRGLVLGVADSARAFAADLPNLQGPALGRELKRLNREILLR